MVPFEFGAQFQLKLFKAILVEDGISDRLIDQIDPDYFASSQLKWLMSQLKKYRGEYGRVPTLGVYQELSRQLPPKMAGMILATLKKVDGLPSTDLEFVKDQTIDWAKRNLFLQAHTEAAAMFEEGKTAEAVSRMNGALVQVAELGWSNMDRGWLSEELSVREKQRSQEARTRQLLTSGFEEIDKLLNGGCEPGFFGFWIAYTGVGKTIMLINQGVAIAKTRKRVLHIVLEGNRRYIENRYDTCFSGELYQDVKKGNFSQAAYKGLFDTYAGLRKMVIIRGMTDRWDYTVEDLDTELKDLKRRYGWSPQAIIVDYGDLLSARDKRLKGWEADEQIYRDLKSIANRGYVVWTASQVQRPKLEDFDETEHVLTTKDIAGGYAKSRVADFVASINATKEERETRRVVRLSLTKVRDSAAGGTILVPADFDRMRFGKARPLEKDPPRVAPPPSPVAEGIVTKIDTAKPKKKVTKKKARKRRTKKRAARA